MNEHLIFYWKNDNFNFFSAACSCITILWKEPKASNTHDKAAHVKAIVLKYCTDFSAVFESLVWRDETSRTSALTHWGTIGGAFLLLPTVRPAESSTRGRHDKIQHHLRPQDNVLFNRTDWLKFIRPPDMHVYKEPEDTTLKYLNPQWHFYMETKPFGYHACEKRAVKWACGS